MEEERIRKKYEENSSLLDGFKQILAVTEEIFYSSPEEAIENYERGLEKIHEIAERKVHGDI